MPAWVSADPGVCSLGSGVRSMVSGVVQSLGTSERPLDSRVRSVGSGVDSLVSGRPCGVLPGNIAKKLQCVVSLGRYRALPWARKRN